ncbi:MAG: 54S ribosomal protein L22, mitochondrial [Claussenomyces sp. TS43310]|nr:MAG: 54S ribosomal protein L22, mitochondrial [Claussenomyces sp. TS43310]
MAPTMSLSSQSGRLLRLAARSDARKPLAFLVPCIQRRTLFWSRKKDNFAAPVNPLTEEFLKRKPKNNILPARGSLASSSIFEDEQLAGPKPDAEKPIGKDAKLPLVRNPALMAAVLDPDPDTRKRWERKMVIREIHKRGRLTRTQLIKRQERESVSKSHNFRTSVKKLQLLARQIAGKTLEDAITQMRFSKKKAAKEVKAHLEHARNEAIVRKGMGLSGEKARLPASQIIRTKDGKRIKATDPTAIYVDQAWVGKGDYGKTPDHRARGQINIMKNPTTHVAVVLKEEATRIRQHEERMEKIKKRKVWTQLPNRPVTAQSQYNLW